MDRLSLEAKKKLIELLLRQEKEIRGILIRSADRIAKQILERQEEGRAYEYLENIEIHLRNQASVIEEELKKQFSEGLIISVEAGLHQSKQATLALLKRARIDWQPIERSYFRVNTSAVESMWQRSIKGLNLSDRIWEKSQKVKESMSAIIQEGIAMGENPVKVAEMLQRYVRDGANTFVVEYPNMMERLNYSLSNDVSYEALRLARTEMAAAYGEGTIQGAKMSPSVLGVQWLLSNAGVACDICKEYANHDDGLGPGVYRLESLPAYPAHPNCLCTLVQINEDIDDFVERLIEWNENPYSQPDIEEWYQREKSLSDVFSLKSDDKNLFNSYGANPIKSHIEWNKYLDISKDVSESLNEVHTQLNEFMRKENLEKLVLLNVKSGKIEFELKGKDNDEIILSKPLISILKNSSPKSFILTHNHPSTTTFSFSDIDKLIRYPSIRALTLEGIDGSKYLLDGINYSHSWKAFFFGSRYDKIYHKITKKYPELHDSSTIENVWDQFLHEVTQEIAREYNLIYKKVN